MGAGKGQVVDSFNRGCNKTRIPEEYSGNVVYQAHNMGNECAGYLAYILDNYDSLPERIVFLQGNPLEHLAVTDDSKVTSVSKVLQQVKNNLEFVDLGQEH